MPDDPNDLFARLAIKKKILSPAQAMTCRQDGGLLAQAAVARGFLPAEIARRLVLEINQQAPGVHPPLAAPAPAAKPAPAAAKPPPKPARAPRPAPAPKPNRTGLLIGAGAATALLLVVVAVVATRGGGAPPAPPAPPAPKPVAQKPAPPPPPKETAPVPPPERPSPPRPPAAVPAPAVVTPEDQARVEFEARRAKKLEEARERLAEVRKELDQERREEAAAAEALRKRLAGKTLSLDLKSGEAVRNAAVKRFSVHEAEIEAQGRTRNVPWEDVKPESLPAATATLYDASSAADQFEKGRFYVARRMWKAAADAFAAAAKLGQGYESRVADFSDTLERLVGGQAGFRGSARRLGRDVVRLTWDLKEARQLEDFTDGLRLEGGAAVLESKEPASVHLWGQSSSGGGESPMAFLGELTAELVLVPDGPVTFLLLGGPALAYELEAGPAGAALHRLDPSAPEKDRRKTVAATDKVKLAAGKAAPVKIQVRYPRFVLQVHGQPAFAVDEPPLPPTQAVPSGPFGVRIPKGKLRLEAPMRIQGRVDSRDLDRRMNDTEVMLRRALDPELDEIERRRARRKAGALLGEGSNLVLGADDPYFTFRIKTNEDLAKYESLKKALAGEVGEDAPYTPEKWLAEVDGLIRKHPDVPSLWYIRALFRNERMDPVGAREDLAKALDLFPAFSEALVTSGDLEMGAGRPAEALKLAARALEARPDSVEALVLRARASFAADPSALQAVMDDLALARKIDPHDPEAVAYQRMFRVQSRGPRDLGCRFDHETAHYRVTTDVSEEAAKRYGENLEAAFRHYAQDFVAPMPTSRKPRVAIFQSAENYYTYFELLSEDRGEHTLGVFRAHLNELVLYESTDFGGDAMHVLYHEAVHHFMTLVTPRTPPFWYNEGIAEYLGAIEVKDGKVVAKAQILKERLQVIRYTIEVGSDYPFAKIMNETPREFYGPGSSIKYAQAWSMIHFFYEAAGGKHRPLIVKYFDLLRLGRTPKSAFDEVFAARADELQKEWRTFVKGLK